MRLILVGALVAAVGCSSGAEPADFLATGGQDAGATGGSAGHAGGAPGTGGGVAASDAGVGAGGAGGAASPCDVDLSTLTEPANSAYSSGNLCCSGPTEEFIACSDAGGAAAQSVKMVVNGQPNGDSSWMETSLMTAPDARGCAVTISYARTETPYADGTTCNEELTVQIIVYAQ